MMQMPSLFKTQGCTKQLVLNETKKRKLEPEHDLGIKRAVEHGITQSLQVKKLTFNFKTIK